MSGIFGQSKMREGLRSFLDLAGLDAVCAHGDPPDGSLDHRTYSL